MAKLLLIIAAVTILQFSTSDFIVSLKPARSFDDLISGEVSAGAHIKGEVPLLLDYFATEKTWQQSSDGSGTPKKTSAYYYILPANNDVWFGVRMRTEDYKGAEKLVDETYNYFMGNGDMPTATIAYEGRTVKMKDEYPQLIDNFREELSLYGFLEEEIEAMGEPLLIVYRSFSTIRGMFALGIARVSVTNDSASDRVKRVAASLSDKTGKEFVTFFVDAVNTREDRFHHVNIVQYDECRHFGRFMENMSDQVLLENEGLEEQIAEQRISRNGRIAVILGSIGIVTTFIPIISFVLGIAGLIKAPKPRLTGGKPGLGLILSILALVFGVGYMVIGVMNM